ncbi:MAG: efflux RND transporter periplasmic adaptor subunit [Pseudomonadota bacterium]
MVDQTVFQTSLLKPKHFRTRSTGIVALSAFVIAVSASTAVAQGNRSVPVFAAPVVEQTMIDRVEALGTLRANESVAVTARVTETITKLHFEDGQRVKQGDVLADMTSTEESALLEEAKATVIEADAQYERAKPLAKRGVSSDAVLSERKRDADTARARLKAVESRLDDRQVRAPFGGVVGLRRISVGALVEPGTLITTIDDDSVMKLDFTIPATFLSSSKIGLPVVATAAAYGDQTFRGKITGVDSRVDPITRSITVRALLPNPDGVLKTGVLMTLEILKNERQAIVIPEEAVVSLGRTNFVYVVDPKAEKPIAERRVLELGSREAGIVEVVSGLAVGDYVVTDGNLKVRPGGPVDIKAIENGSEPLAKLLKQGAETRKAAEPRTQG